MSWKFHNGRAKLKTKQELNQFSIAIPQSDGTTAVIPLEGNDVTKKTLGVWSNPLNKPTVPLVKLKEKGLDWVDKLRVRPLERKLTWLSLTSQQYPTLFYGLSSLYASPDELETVMGSVYFNALPFLGYNRNINKAYRTLPTDFQGIGLKHWSIEKLGKDTAVLLRHWQSGSALGMALEFVFLMEVGLDGNVLTQRFDRFQHLATHSWFKILWQYADRYELSITFNSRFNVGPIRRGDMALMELFARLGYSSDSMEVLNRCRRDNLQVFHHLLPNDKYTIYQRDDSQRTTRSGPRYTKISTHNRYPTDASLYASVDPNPSPNIINLHSTCDIYDAATNQSTFLSCLRSFSNQSLWDNLEIDGDGGWLITSIIQGTLEIGMDGSYMKDLSTSACSGTFILHCTNTLKEIKGCFVDSSHQADNYGGEFLGALGPLLLLRAAFMANPQVDAATVKIRLYCENKGVVAHGNKVDEVLKLEQVQADLIRLMKT
eukprot:scaffold19184_cov46-Cyclotella_meneghiniana.AAC.5